MTALSKVILILVVSFLAMNSQTQRRLLTRRCGRARLGVRREGALGAEALRVEHLEGRVERGAHERAAVERRDVRELGDPVGVERVEAQRRLERGPREGQPRVARARHLRGRRR